MMGFINSMRGVSLPLIRDGFNASYNDIGLMGAMLSFSGVCISIAAGVYMSRLGLKKTMISGFIIMALGVGSIYFSSGFWMAAGLYLIFQAGFLFIATSINGTGVRVFTVKSGLMMNLLHFCFGVGAICGPRFMGFMLTRVGLRWQEVYPLTLVLVFTMLIITLTTRFPGKAETTAAAETPSYWTVLKDPAVWLFGVIIGVASSIEGCSTAWSGLYLYDVYGLDPGTVGAAFISAFFMLFTLSRLLSGFVIEKAGYMRSLHISSAVIIVLFITAFSLGIKGIYLLPVVGFFIAIMWPTVLAVSVSFFGNRAVIASSAIGVIASATGGIIQYGFGLSNRFLGAAWAYRSCILYSTILLILLLFLGRKIRAQGEKSSGEQKESGIS